VAAEIFLTDLAAASARLAAAEFMSVVEGSAAASGTAAVLARPAVEPAKT